MTFPFILGMKMKRFSQAQLWSILRMASAEENHIPSKGSLHLDGIQKCGFLVLMTTPKRSFSFLSSHGIGLELSSWGTGSDCTEMRDYNAYWMMVLAQHMKKGERRCILDRNISYKEVPSQFHGYLA